MFFWSASATMDGVGVLRADCNCAVDHGAVRGSGIACGHFYPLLPSIALRSRNEDGARPCCRLAAALCGHVWLGQHGLYRGPRLRWLTGDGAIGLRHPGGELRGGGGDLLLWTQARV